MTEPIISTFVSIVLDMKNIVQFHPWAFAAKWQCFPLLLQPQYTHFTIKNSTTAQANTVITTSDFRIHEYMMCLTEKAQHTKGKRKKKSAYNQCNLNRIDLNSNSPLWFPTAAEFACIGLDLFESVRACSALFTVKRMKMSSQIVLHL